MTDHPITPSRIIPAGAPLPARPPQHEEIPPWRPAPSPPVAPPPPPPSPAPVPLPPDPDGGMVIRHVHEVLLVVPEPEPETPRWWERLWDHIVTWRMVVAILAALLPWAGGRSPVGIWSHTVHTARTEAGIGAAYVIAAVAVGAAFALDRHTGRAIPRALLVTAMLGAFGVLNWWDPILMLTGVHR